MSLKSWINDKLPDWAWNLKNRLKGSPYRTHTFRARTEEIEAVNYTLEGGVDEQGFWSKLE